MPPEIDIESIFQQVTYELAGMNNSMGVSGVGTGGLGHNDVSYTTVTTTTTPTRPTVGNKNVDKDTVFYERVRDKILCGGRVSDADMNKYVELVKKTRHIDRMERSAFHKLKSDGDKNTYNLNVDDILEVT